MEEKYLCRNRNKRRTEMQSESVTKRLKVKNSFGEKRERLILTEKNMKKTKIKSN